MITSVKFGVYRRWGADRWHLVGMETDTYNAADGWLSCLLRNDRSLTDGDLRIEVTTRRVATQADHVNSDI